MITTPFYYGQGLGNQLWSWSVLTSIAIDRGFSWGIQAPWKFKGSNFINLDYGRTVFGFPSNEPNEKKPWGIKHYYRERLMLHKDLHFDISLPDPNIIEIEDSTKIDGTFQSIQYISKHRPRLMEALKVSPKDKKMTQVCIIHFRGGDFAGQEDVFLGVHYYTNAMQTIREFDPEVKFKVITNDVPRASSYFPSTEIVSPYKSNEVYSGPNLQVDSRVQRDFALMQNADYLILSNSSFSWWAAWTNRKAARVIAPKYWARHNLNGPYWSSGGVIVPEWEYLDTKGQLFPGSNCVDYYRDFVGSASFQYYKR